MQAVPSVNAQRRGGRTSSPQYRKAQDFCKDFTGLEEGARRYDLLLLVKRAGKEAGFTPAMIRLLDYYMAYTREIDWEAGSRPIVYQSIQRTALDLGITERQVQKIERQLFERGAITWNDSGNHRRYGARDEETGRLLWAYGVDLTPLAYLREELQDKVHEKQLREKAWMEAKRQVSFYRAQIRAMLGEAWQLAEAGRGPIDADTLMAFQHEAESIAKPIRTYMTLDAVRDLQHAHKALYAALKAHLPQDASLEMTQPVSQHSSPSDEQNFAHKETINQQPSNELDTGNPADLNVDVQVRQGQASAAEGLEDASGNAPKVQAGRGEVSQVPERQSAATPVPTPPARAGEGPVHACGLEHLTWKQIMMAASERFMGRLVCHTAGMQRPFVAGDCVRAAYDLTQSLGISHNIWAEACAMLGDKAAAVCVILIDHAVHKADNPVRKPGAYFRAMVRKSESGELHLDRSVFGLLKAGRGVIDG